MRVHTIAFAMIVALFQVGPCQADFWPDHAPGAFKEYAESIVNTSHDPAVTGRTVPIVSLDVRTDALGHVLFAEGAAAEARDEIVLAEMPQPTDAGDLITQDIMVQLLKAAARARLATDDEVLNRMIAAYLEADDLTTGALPRSEELRPYVSHEAEDAAGGLTIGSVVSRPAAGGGIIRGNGVALAFELPSGI